MPVQTRARAKATDKPPSPLKNILKAPARRAAKARPASPITTSNTKVTKKAHTKAPKAALKTAQAANESSKRAALTRSKGGRKTKVETHAEEKADVMEPDSMMADAPAADRATDCAVEDSARTDLDRQDATGHLSPVKTSKIPKASPTTSPSTASQSARPLKENTPLRHKISSTRLVKTAMIKKPSKEGLMSRSPLKSSLSLQSLLSPQRPKNTAQLSAADTKQFTFSRPAPAAADAPFMADDVFQDHPIEPIFRYSSILSPEKASLGSPRKAPAREKFLSTSPSRKNRSPENRRPAPTSPPTSPERMMNSLMPFSSLFPGIPSSPASSPEHPAMHVASSPRQPLSEMGSPTIPARSSSRSPTKHRGEPLVSRSPSKVPRLSPSKSSLRVREPVPDVSPAKVSQSQRTLQSPTKSSMRSPTKSRSTPTLSPKKSVTWNQPQHLTTSSIPDSSALNGCVFYVDVRTADGNDAGPFFIPLLTDMGATVVSQWISNSMPITHVLFKDGDDRTLEKVVASNGSVKCVNVGWAVDCERFNKRLPEQDYAIDLSRIPGQTPNTTPRSSLLSPIATNPEFAATPVPKTPLPQTSLNINNAKISITTPAFLAGSKTCGAKSNSFSVSFHSSFSQMEGVEEDKENAMPDEKLHSSPATPYFLHPQDLVQKSCPPKPALRCGADQRMDSTSREVNKRLLLAKRKSMEWAPKVSSPLRLSSGGE